jgi:hypothetical protein
MNALDTTATTNASYGPAFWGRLWRSAGIQSAGLFVVAYLFYGSQPDVGASPDALAAFYQGDRTRILFAVVIAGFAILNLLWFVAAIRAALADARQDGWGAAATASSAAVGASALLLITISAGLAYSIASAADRSVVSGLNDLAWAGLVLSSFPRAMLIMSGSFGLWRTGLISNTLFAVAVAAVVLVLAGGTTWMSGGLWAPDGAYSRLISPIIGLVWLTAVSGLLLTRVPPARTGW